MASETGLFLGIDTGGTFTDGVLLDPVARTVVRSTKVLTTHQNLSLCISEMIEQMTRDLPAALSMVSLSTTLATNAIAEGKRGPVGLLLLGYDPELVHKFHFHHQFGTPHYHFIPGRHGLDGVEQIPLDENRVAQAVQALHGKVEAFAISSYAGFRNTAHEERAEEITASLTPVPIVVAHQLSSEPDSIRRATTASLNASLLANTQEFLSAVQAMLSQRRIDCPVMMVKGDGSIVRAEYARRYPVEIIHSGPATSAAGGQFLAGVDTGLVIDIGGTTTDIALVENGQVQIETSAATVGHYRTCVKTIKVRSFGLGGDSLIRFDSARSLSVGPERVLPFSHLCSEYPHIQPELSEWLRQKKEIVYYDRLEVWVLRREPAQPLEDARTRKAVDLLRDGPRLLFKLLKQVGAVSPAQLFVDDLFRQGVIERAGLTPTDLLHATGEYAPWDAQIARQVVETVARVWGIRSEDFIQRVKDLITRRITAEIIQFLSGKTLSEPAVFLTENKPLDRWLFEESLEPQDGHLSCRIFLKDPIVGIGAPARAFLPDVARALGTSIIFPENYAVANAVGAVVGNVMVRLEGAVSPLVEGQVVTGYFGQAASLQQQFSRYDDAQTFARQQLARLTVEEAVRAGAAEPQVECTEKEIIPGMMMQLSAWAVARPGLNGRK